MLRLDLNVSILLREYPFLQRFDHAARLGFDAVEFWWPSEDLGAVASRIKDAGLHVALFNFDAGDISSGERGFLNDPQREARFRANVPVAIELAQGLGCRRLNALAGTWRRGEKHASQLERVRENLRFACAQAEAAGITVLVESLNSWENGRYMFTNTADTLRFLASVGAPNLQYQYDVYHMQRMEGNIVATIQAHSAQIGHIQVADSPHRHQPGSGELNYPYIFRAIEASDYDGWVGLEYHPLGSSEASMAWLPPRRGGLLSSDALFASRSERV